MTKEDENKYKKDYVLNNPQKIKETGKKYRENNKEKLRDKYLSNIHLQEKRKEKTVCECGGSYTYTHKAEHLRCKRHLTYFGAK